mgnify:CR=1 FL=1
MLQSLTWMLGLMMVASACTMTSPSPTQTPDFPRPVTMAPSTVQPTRTIAPNAQSLPADFIITPISNCPNAPRIRLIVQERGQVTEVDERRLNMRLGPGTDYAIVRRIEPGEVFFVLDGPECAEVYSWFRVRYGDQAGWIAEGDPEAYYVQPFLPG